MWHIHQPVEVVFGEGTIAQIGDIRQDKILHGKRHGHHHRPRQYGQLQQGTGVRLAAHLCDMGGFSGNGNVLEWLLGRPGKTLDDYFRKELKSLGQPVCG